jgi:DNA-binding NtrC family response regulator
MVLVLESDQALRELLGTVVEESGYRPVLATSTAEARGLVDGARPSAILTNFVEAPVTMLDRGYLTRLATSWPDTPIILCTARVEAPTIDPVELGLYALVAKPFDVEFLLDLLQRAVDRRPPQGKE